MSKTSSQIFDELKSIAKDIEEMQKEKGVDFMFSIIAARGEEEKDEAFILDTFRHEENVKGFTIVTLLESRVAQRIFETILKYNKGGK